MSKSRICKAFNNTRVILLALFVALLFASCSPSSLTLCRVGIDNDKDSRTLSAVIDPLGSNIYYRTIYKGSGEYYSSNFSTSYNRLTGEGIIVSQGLWEVQVVFSNEEKTSYTESEATSLIHATSGDIFINLNTTSITVEIESGDGYAVLSSYTLTGSIPSSPAIEVELLTYNGNAFEAFNDSKYDISGFTGITIGENYTYSNSVTALPAGVYCLIVYAKSSSEVCFTDVLGFVVRSGLTTTITGSCSEYNKTSSIVIDSEYLKPLNPNGESSGTGSGDAYKVVDVGDINTSSATPIDFDVVQQNSIHVIQAAGTGVMLDHTGSSSTMTSNRIETPNGTKYAINLNGKSVTLSKIQNNGNGVENESALVTNLNENSYLTIYNNNGLEFGQRAKFADLQYNSGWRNENRRLQTNIELSKSTLNIVGDGATDNISNAGIIFYGPLATDINVNSGEYRQGSINLKDTGGIINLDGNVSVRGVVGISSWTIYGANTLSGKVETTINIKERAEINTSSTDSYEGKQCESAEDQATAHGIYIKGNMCNSDSSITIFLTGGSSIKTACVGNKDSAGIRIENVSGTLKITLDGSSINATNGYGIYLNNCSNVEIELKNGSSITGTKGALSFTGSNVSLKVDGVTSTNPTNIGNTIQSK